jgi:hypothetical protein
MGFFGAHLMQSAAGHADDEKDKAEPNGGNDKPDQSKVLL